MPFQGMFQTDYPIKRQPKFPNPLNATKTNESWAKTFSATLKLLNAKRESVCPNCFHLFLNSRRTLSNYPDTAEQQHTQTHTHTQSRRMGKGF